MDSMGSTSDNVMNGSSFSGTQKLSQMIPLNDIKLDPEFQALFPLDEDMVVDVARSIEESGFDPTQPLVVWGQPDGSIVLIDGHTRYAAVKRTQYLEVPVFVKDFKTRDEAMYYAIGLQLFRRNLSQQQMVGAAKRLIDLGEKTGNVRIKDVQKSLEKRLGVSKTTAGKIISVAKNEEALESVTSGEKSINQAYNDLEKHKHNYPSERMDGSAEQADSDEASGQEADNDVSNDDAAISAISDAAAASVAAEAELESDESANSGDYAGSEAEEAAEAEESGEAEPEDSFVDGDFSMAEDDSGDEADFEEEEYDKEEEPSVHADVGSVAGNRNPAVSPRTAGSCLRCPASPSARRLR